MHPDLDRLVNPPLVIDEVTAGERERFIRDRRRKQFTRDMVANGHLVLLKRPIKALLGSTSQAQEDSNG